MFRPGLRKLLIGILILALAATSSPAEPPAPALVVDTGASVDRLVVSLERFRLRAFSQGRLVAAYPVAIGADTGPTPRGEFTIVNKLRNPWYVPDDEPAQPPGSPDNPLGSRWLGIDKPHYGIHGTTNPASLGTRASEGCVRLHNRHVEQLYRMVDVGTRLIVRETFEEEPEDP